MWVGALKVELFISDSRCLKDKRSVIKALKDSLRNKFNIAISDVDSHDKWQKAALGIATVGPDKAAVQSALDKVLDVIRQNPSSHITEYEMEIL
ncbi:MAG: DUF503 domain-containing protein [Candidatus Omnitrophica bacterium]|nr:DUF503 domain-containing protein [Candidatus Omnitrophota bacterium]